MPETPTIVPDSVAWKTRQGEASSHAFSTAPGWMRSVCRREIWTVLLQPADETAERCVECVLLTDGAPGEISEAWGR